MRGVAVHVVVEDDLSYTVITKILHELRLPVTIQDRLPIIGRRQAAPGMGYIKNRIVAFNRAAAYCPFIVLTDLDAGACPSALIAAWLSTPRHADLLLRVAVREVESWVLADRTAFHRQFRVPMGQLPQQSDAIHDPKQFLLRNVQRYAVRALREAITRKHDTNVSQGPDYNGTLGGFVEDHWNLTRARQHSESLDRAARRLSERFARHSAR